jgi:hypothetical protein
LTAFVTGEDLAVGACSGAAAAAPDIASVAVGLAAVGLLSCRFLLVATAGPHNVEDYVVVWLVSLASGSGGRSHSNSLVRQSIAMLTQPKVMSIHHAMTPECIGAITFRISSRSRFRDKR